MRGSLLAQHQLTIQALTPKHMPDGGIDNVWVDVITTTGNVMPVDAMTRLRYQQTGQSVTHTVRLAAEPHWLPLSPKDRGYPWPDQMRVVYHDRTGRYRVLTYAGGYNPAEAGRTWRMIAREESETQQFPH